MNLAGWIFMIISWAVIIGLFVFCMFRTLRPSRKESTSNETSQQSKS
jgi:uncharacterized membrane protein